MNPNLIFDIAGLIEKSTGSSEQYTFDLPIDYEEIDPHSNLTGTVDIMRIEKSFNVIIKNVRVLSNSTCEKCLKKFDANVRIPAAERQFYINRPQKVEDPADLFLINKKNLTLDINEMMRQEIILHFPMKSVCSTHCKGICAYCGTDKNKEQCECKEEVLEVNKPLSALKDLLKN